MPSIVFPSRASIFPSSIEAVCRRWQVRELFLFGSAVRDDFTERSDIDLVVDFLSDAEPTIYDLAALVEELEDLIGRRIDLHTLRGVENDRNRLRRKEILGTMVPVYVA